MGPEDIVVEKVVDYFSAPKFERLSTRTEYPVQMGVYKGRADVVLLDKDKKVAAIIECKKIGYEGSGPDQLRGYLAATDTPLGIFANETDPTYWTFYENLGQNQFREITRSQFEKRVSKKGILKALKEFVRWLFPKEKPVIPPGPESIRPPERKESVYPRGNQTVQNKNWNNSVVDSSLNGNGPYYSEQNGFDWATKHLGMASLLPRHIERIIQNEVEAIESNPEWYEEEIRLQKDNKAQLEDQKHSYEGEIKQKNQELAHKKEDLAKLEIELNALIEEESNLLVDQNPVRTDPDAKPQFSWNYLITGIVATVLLVGLASYLFVFYASAVDKAFFLKEASIAGLNDIVNPVAIFEALEGRWNLFVILFPFIFLAFALALDHFWESSKQWWQKWPSLGLVILTFAFDGILAIQISQKLHDARFLTGLTEQEWIFRWNDLNIWTVLFCGFMVSLLVSILYHVTRERWKGVKPNQIATKEKEREREHKKQEAEKKAGEKKAIRIQKEIQKETLTVAMQTLQNEIDEIKDNKFPNTEQRIAEVQKTIENLSARSGVIVINRDKIEAQINQFVIGWCQFVVQRGAEQNEIENIQQTAKATLDEYYRKNLIKES